jgi:two-component system nitrate/nitrite response regulator NarL
LIRRLASLARSGQPASPIGPLTTREREILELIDEGFSNKQIAQRLRIELPTVKNHVHHILVKLGVNRRAEAAALARSSGLRSRAGEALSFGD